MKSRMNEVNESDAKQAPQGGWIRYITQGWLVLVLALCFGGMLAGVDAGLKDRIAENKRNDTLGAIPGIVPGSATGNKTSVGQIVVYEAVDQDGNQVGWVLPAEGQGFADKIELLIGLDTAAGKITGLYVLAQKETPGLGNKIENKSWRKKFAGLPADVELKVKPPGNQIDSVTGATVSSEAVCKIVNDAVKAFREALAAANNATGNGN